MRSASKRPFLLHLKVTTAPKPGCRAHLQGCPFHHPSKDLSLPPRHCWGKLRQERTGMAGWWYQTHPWGHPCRSGRNQPISHSSGGTCCQQCSQTCGRAMLPGDGHTGVPLTLWCAQVCPPSHTRLWLHSLWKLRADDVPSSYLHGPQCTCPSLQPKMWDPVSTQKMTRSRKRIKGSLNNS